MSAKDELKSNLPLLQTLLDESESGIILMNPQGTIVLANERFSKITGYTIRETEGRIKWKDLLSKEEGDRLSRYFKLFKADPKEISGRTEARVRDKSGNIRNVYFKIFTTGKPELTGISFVDITEQKVYEHQLQQAKEEAVRSERLKTEFLANMSHEIRTPINSIVGFADLLKLDDLPEEKRTLYLNQVIHGSHDLLVLIEKIITISRIDSGQVSLSKREFNLNLKLRELESRFRSELDSRGKEHIELIMSPGISEDFYLVGDPFRFSEVVSNLLENAIKFTEQGHIEFGYYLLEEPDQEQGSESLLFFVKDSGPGIEKSNKEVIFDRFVKIIEKEETIYKGAGLGLTIAKEITELFDGTIWVESTKGSGSRFFFTYPLGPAKMKKQEQPVSEKVKSSTDWSDKQVLIAEDVESNYLYIKELLSPSGIRILRARDGVEAVEIFRSHPGIDIVIMDILMPGMDGYEATAQIRQIKNDIPVIAQSAFTFEGDIQEGLYAGSFNDYIMKPYTRKVLLGVMKKFLNAE